MAQIKIQQFEGPLDLLLSLIEEQKLNISEISLAQVTEQFLNYVRQLEDKNPTALADYLAIAAKLLVIKSKAMLPSLEIETEEEEEQEEDLAEKLILYKQFKEVARYLKKLDQKGNQSFTRTLVFSQRINFWPDPAVDKDVLHSNIRNVVQALKELDNLPKAKVKEAVSIQEKILHLQGMLSRQIETKLSDLLSTSKNKGEVIITFLALLELIKQRMFSVNQDELFADVTIKRYEPTEEVSTGSYETEANVLDEPPKESKPLSEITETQVTDSTEDDDEEDFDEDDEDDEDDE